MATTTTETGATEVIPHPIETVLKLYVEHINSLFKALFLTMAALQNTDKRVVEVLAEFEKKNCTITEPDEDGLSYINVGENYVKRWNLLNQEVKQIRLSRSLVPASFLASLVSQYDGFLGQLIKALFDIKPELLNSSEKNITYSQLLEFGSVEAAKEYLLEKEIETVLRKSHTEQFDWLEGKFVIELRKDLPSWPIFIELTERRNLFVHTRGIVSSQYMKVCAQHKVKLADDVKVGTQLFAGADYMTSAFACIFEIGVKLAHVLWRKMQPETRKEADESLAEISYQLIYEDEEKRIEIAANLLDFGANTLKKFSSEQLRRRLIINRAQAYKWLGKDDVARKIIQAEDWTATSDDFKLAEAVILENYKDADEIMLKMGKNGPVTTQSYREWPLFKRYVERPEFKVLFKTIFEEDFLVVEAPISAPIEPLVLNEHLPKSPDEASTGAMLTEDSEETTS
jgi:hypothetical protein